jgi:hypothetical protein
MIDRLIELGPKRLSNNDLENFGEVFGEMLWVVYWYDDYCYEGRGTAIIALLGDKFRVVNLGHCSCHGPTDRLRGDVLPRNELFRRLKYDRFGRRRSRQDFDWEQWDAIGREVRKLLREVAPVEEPPPFVALM